MFRYCGTSAERKNFSGESWHTSPSYARKISILKILWNTKGFPYEMRQYCEPKTLTRILMPTPFLVLNVFRYRKFSETQRVPWRNLSVLCNKIVLRRILIPYPPYAWKISEPDFFWNDEGFPTKRFDTVRQKIFRIIVMPTHFLFPSIFPKINFWNTEGLLYEMFRYCKMKPFRRTIVTTAPFIIFNIFRFQKDLEHKKVPLRKVSVLWDQKSRRRIVMPTHFSLTFST